MTTLYSVGHSTHAAEEFTRLLKAHGIEMLVDIRSMPGSNRFPHFNSESMQCWIDDAGITYRHIPELGGRRKAQHIDRATNAGWRSASFHNYADYGLTPTFAYGLKRLLEIASLWDRVAYMCSEAVPWRCHRLLVSNALVARNVQVEHIVSEGPTITHKFGMFGAKPEHRNGYVVYPKVA